MGRLTEIIAFVNSDMTTGEAGRTFTHYKPGASDLKVRSEYKKRIKKANPEPKAGEQLSLF